MKGIKKAQEENAERATYNALISKYLTDNRDEIDAAEYCKKVDNFLMALRSYYQITDIDKSINRNMQGESVSYNYNVKNHYKNSFLYLRVTPKGVYVNSRANKLHTELNEDFVKEVMVYMNKYYARTTLNLAV